MNGFQCGSRDMTACEERNNWSDKQPTANQFPCAAVHDEQNKKKKYGSSKSFIPSYLHDKEVMARMVSHDYGSQWLAERDAWHEQHATSDDSLRTRMLERCQTKELQLMNAQKCFRELEVQIAKGRLAGSKNQYKHIQGALNTHWKPYPPIKGWRC